MAKEDKIILFLILLTLVFSSYLAATELLSSKETFCLTGESCDIVRNSVYSSLAGIKLVWIGFFYSIALLISFSLVKNNKISKEYFTLITGIGSAFAVYFLFIQIFIIGKICSNCFIIDSSIIAIFLILLNKNRKSQSSS